MWDLLKSIFGTKNEREIKRFQPLVDKINSLEPGIQKLSDNELKDKTNEFKERLAKGETLDDLLPEAYAVVRETAKRTIGQRHFDVQLIGGIVLHQGRIAEMKTGEGKTLVSTLPVYLNALTGKGVHIITVNDYLAERDSFGKGNFKGMGNIYGFLGLTFGCIRHDSTPDERKAAYGSDITYGTNNEFGFDYLRDNMVSSINDIVQGELNYAIVDEVDSILIDEARTPLIISGPAEESTDKYYKMNRLAPSFEKEVDFKIDEKTKTVSITEAGVAKAEKLTAIPNLFDGLHLDWIHHLINALRAHIFFKRDVDYMIKDGEVLIVDEFTGRLMPGRRWSDGLHQAIEAKEGVEIRRENQTLATITFQNYFRMYKKLSGMTGTAETEAVEFMHIYKLDVVIVPTNKPMIRVDYPDVVYKTRKEKLKAIVEEIIELNKIGRPVLVGTTSIERNEELSLLLNKRGVKHQLLNAKFHEKEAEIISSAGQRGTVTVATNMAGRGTDIVLGEGVAVIGGLHVLGTERHEARRIDNQLRGRCGRQGDLGSSRFYLTLEDDLMRIFGGEKIFAIMDRFGMEEDTQITHPWISRTIEGAQKKVENYNFEIRKHLLEYDDVMNKQREVVYSERKLTLEGKDLRGHILRWISDNVEILIDTYAPEKASPYEWDLDEIKSRVGDLFTIDLYLKKEEILKMRREALKANIEEDIKKKYETKVESIGSELFNQVEKMVMLQVVDSKWKDHLYNMDQLKEGIGLRGYAGKDPLIEYKREGYEMFMDMISRIKEEVVKYLFRIQIKSEERPSFGVTADKRLTNVQYQHKEVEQFNVVAERARRHSPTREMEAEPEHKLLPVKRTSPKVGRNDPCPCGSGKKYKKCCGNKL
ncbi:MAG: preprotein translocase subunit SecA [Candidatus Firestonebacteria bacterium]